MPFEFLEDSVTSDVTFRAWGRTLDELFAAAVDAATSVMVTNLDAVGAAVTVPVTIRADALDLALLRLLDEVVFQKDTAGLLLRVECLHVEATAGAYRVDARLRGELIDRDRHHLEADVKATTWHGLRVERTPSGWQAQVTLDV